MLQTILSFLLVFVVLSNLRTKQPHNPTKSDYFFFYLFIFNGLIWIVSPTVSIPLSLGFFIAAFSQYYCLSLFYKPKKVEDKIEK